MLKFLRATTDRETGADRLTAFYELVHVTPGRGGTHLKLGVKLSSVFGKTTAEMLKMAPEVATADPEVALDKLAEWLERSASAIRARGTPLAVINDYPQN